MAKNGRLVVFNWKENPRTLHEASRLFSATLKIAREGRRGNIEIVACLPFTYLSELSRTFAHLPAFCSLGAQDVFWENGGAYTGEIGPAMLRNVGKNVRYVIVGHSERRRLLHETDEMINEKVRAALVVGLRVILCVGEPMSVRRAGIRAARQYVKDQLRKDLRGIRALSTKRLALIIAYEPIWAIGTGRNCPPVDACDMAIFIKKETHIGSVLYGGSVNGGNIGDYLCYHGIDGALVGGASLHTTEVRKIIKNIQ